MAAGRDVRKAVASGRRIAGSFCVLRVLRRRSGGGSASRFAYIASKRQGGSVERNRMKRRLREAVRAFAPAPGSAAGDVAVICRKEALRAPWSALCAEVAQSLCAAGVAGGPVTCD
ncbi:MAG: ribonuclease P protein component [Armatimonadetes bacterium]|nr:ribonuclease P protein component [Armatimonadota bacterium]MDE2206122.1 ribonuclease P protein component [Armatimonadota bacterium]